MNWALSVLCVCVIIFCFFFFKQKTAYEMRISDWSSDVCSSDLAPLPHAGEGGAQRRVRARRSRHRKAAKGDRVRHASAVTALDMPPSAPRLRGEIGRASCRERVCQYV